MIRYIFISLIFFVSTSYSQEYSIKKVLDLNEPWVSTFINNNNLLITEKSGKIKIINLKTKEVININHNLNVLEYGQGGLLDIIFENNTVWVSYTEDRGNYKTSTSIAKGQFNKKLIDFKNIFQAEPPIDSPYHFGSRLVIKDNYSILFSIHLFSSFFKFSITIVIIEIQDCSFSLRKIIIYMKSMFHNCTTSWI